MSNPNNAIGTNGAYGGRTSVNAFNDVLGAFSKGILSGWACSPDTGLTVVLGGDGTNRDVAIAEDNAGNKTTINNISGSPISITIPSAPASNSRIDLIVAYVDNPPEGTSTVTDNPAACGFIVVSGTPASTPIPPDDNAIRTAITADGASGATAYYVILSSITIASGTTTIVSGNISQISYSLLGLNQLGNGTIPASKLDMSTLGGDYNLSEINTGYKWIDGSYIYKKTIDTGALPDSTYKQVPLNTNNINRIIKFEGYAHNPSTNNTVPLPFCSNYAPENCIAVSVINNTYFEISAGIDRSVLTESYITIYYTKTS